MQLDLFYDPDGEPLTMQQWEALFSKRMDHTLDPNWWRVGRTFLEHEVEVSTIWVGIDMSFGYGPPLIFETAVFGLEEEYEMRYPNWDSALAGHDQAVAWATERLGAKK